ncbi:hypothetical protein [Ochrovirga pacifica]|uniref:hypothetical protein n=1 Tax=Ochrovirga pacifica TaxID=1042376 RepID=UPI0002557750|nr:hypothetical protein [Ochrovirga pacifica]
MKKHILSIIITATLFACTPQKDTTIGLNKVGSINQNTRISDIQELFKKDSIVSRYSEGALGDDSNFLDQNDSHLIYNKTDRTLMLSIAPVNSLDSISKIRSVTIHNDQYKTEAGVGVSSTFKDLNIHHNIEKLEATFHSITVFVKDINATFTLDKSKAGVKTFTLGPVDKAQIPEDTPFTSMTIWLE